ncbi:glycosyltransferase family 4 protein [Winogradskyella sp. R77965]|uniref:glycosyltransferase family 4 protein n=1 Tax=Winogradskyella sp. R77965 TaxID=3093872 RepID=UPI0037DC77BC
MTNKKQYNILIVGPFPKPITGNSLANQILFDGLSKKENVKVRRVNSSTSFFDEKVGSFSLKKAFNGIRFNLQIYKIFQSNAVYVTPGQSFFGVLKYGVIILTSKMLKRKIIIHIHGNYLREEYKRIGKLKKIIVKVILRMADKGIVLSRSLIPNLTPFLKKENIKIIYNFVEDYLLEDTKKIINNKRLNTLRIVYLSNLMLEKGILDLLKALKEMEINKLEYRAKLAGNIDLNSKKKIDNYLNQLNNAEYLGVVEGDRKKELLLWGNVFIFPSYYRMEGQPISIIEAMATGNVVLASNHAGISDIFSSKNGLFIRSKDYKDILNKLKIISLDKPKFEEILVKNYLYASKTYKADIFVNKIETIITQND